MITLSPVNPELVFSLRKRSGNELEHNKDKIPRYNLVNTSWATLPVDIIRLIFQHCDWQYETLPLSLVCKNFRAIVSTEFRVAIVQAVVTHTVFPDLPLPLAHISAYPSRNPTVDAASVLRHVTTYRSDMTSFFIHIWSLPNQPDLQLGIKKIMRETEWDVIRVAQEARHLQIKQIAENIIRACTFRFNPWTKEEIDSIDWRLLRETYSKRCFLSRVEALRGPLPLALHLAFNYPLTLPLEEYPDELCLALLQFETDTPLTSSLFASRDESFWITAAQIPSSLRRAPDAIKNNLQVVLAHLRVDGHAYQYASAALQRNEQVIEEAFLKSKHPPYWSLPLDLKMARKDILKNYVQIKGAVLIDTDIPDHFKEDEEILLASLKTHPEMITIAPLRLFHNTKFWLKAIQVNPRVILYLPEYLPSRRQIVNKAVELDPNAMTGAPYSFKTRKRVIDAFHRGGDQVYASLDESSRACESIALEALQCNIHNIAYCPLESMPLEFIFKAVKINVKLVGLILSKYLKNPELKNSPPFYSRILAVNPNAFAYFPFEVRDNADLMLKLIRIYAIGFQYISSRLYRDFDFTVKALQTNAQVASFVAPEFRIPQSGAVHLAS
jgi:hypothetical protein